MEWRRLSINTNNTRVNGKIWDNKQWVKLNSTWLDKNKSDMTIRRNDVKVEGTYLRNANRQSLRRRGGGNVISIKRTLMSRNLRKGS